MADIKELLGEQLFNQVMSKLDGKELIINDGSYVPRSRLNEVNGKATALQSKVESYEKQIQDTQALLKGSEELKGQYAQLQEKYKSDLSAKDKDIANIYKKSMVKEALIKEGAKHVDLLMAQVNLDSLSVDNGNLIGGQDVIGKLKTDYKDLFVQSKTEGTQSGDGNTNTGGTTGTKDWAAVVKGLVNGNS
jgi:hypothetical protein